MDKFVALTKRRYFFPVLFVFCLAVMFTRRPDVLTDACFWAEDGAYWYTQMCRDGIMSLFSPANGYFQTVSRLTMFLTVPFGIMHAPFVANLTSLVLRVLPVLFLFSARFPFIPVPYKMLMALYWLLFPNAGEVWGNITNVHWFLALWLLAVIIAEAPKTLWDKAHDYFVLILSGLSGPFIVFIAVCVAVKKFFLFLNGRKFAVTVFESIIFGITLLQAAAVALTGTQNRSPMELGASFATLSELVDIKIIAGAFLPQNLAYPFFTAHPIVAQGVFVVFVFAIALLFVNGSWRVKTVMTFPLLMIGASLYKPMASFERPQWEVIVMPGACDRYFVVTSILLFAALLYTAYRFNARLRQRHRPIVFAVPIVILSVTAILSYKIAPLPDGHWPEKIRDIYAPAPSGTLLDIPINPAGWYVTLTKE